MSYDNTQAFTDKDRDAHFKKHMQQLDKAPDSKTVVQIGQIVIAIQKNPINGRFYMDSTQSQKFWDAYRTVKEKLKESTPVTAGIDEKVTA